MTTYTKNPSLLKAAKQIFGDVVVDAFGLPDARFSIRKMKTDELLLDWGSEDIVLEFINGNKVRMTNSEWANFILVNSIDVKE